MTARYTVSIQMQGSTAEIRRRIETAVRSSGAEAITWSEEGTRCQAVYGGTFRSFGERLTVDIEAARTVVVQSISTLPTTLFDWGKNRENCERVAVALKATEPVADQQRRDREQRERQQADQRRGEAEQCRFRGRAVPNYYTVLEVAPHARQSLIERAYKALMMEEHPDRGGETRRAQLINEAFEVLGHPSRRDEFDRENGFMR